MASSRDRQRQLARAKLDRQIANRSARARRRRQVNAGVGIGLAVLLLVGGGMWWGGVFDSKPEAPVVAGDCVWTKATGDGIKDVGQPPTTVSKAGTEALTITTSLGVLEGQIDVAKAPCTAASMSYLAGHQFFNNTKCHRLSLTPALPILQCGSPAGDGTGGPSYSFASERVTPDPVTPDPSASPAATPAAPVYKAGTIVLTNHGQGTNGSQFYVFYKDAPAVGDFAIVGNLTKGVDLIAKAAADGVVDAEGKPKTDEGAPKTPIFITNLTVGKPTESAS